MKLDRINIRNFRSIKKVDIQFDPTCRVLVGINESGKTNILDALALLSDNYNPVKKDDLREALPNESPVTASYVRFVFKFQKEESDELFDQVASKILSNAKNPSIVSINGKKKNLKEFCATQSEGIYSANIVKEKKFFRYWGLGVKYKLLEGWIKPTSSCPSDFEVELKKEKVQLKDYRLIRKEDIEEVPAEYYEEADIEDLDSLCGNAITEITKDNLPDTLFWEYDEDSLLPGSVSIADFSEKPDTCIPLKNMFALAGIEDIKSSIEDAQQGTDNQFQNYLDRIAKQNTNHFRRVWKEYRNIEFSLKLNADNIIPGVKEKNTHDFSRRSDGFKRFVTFLLMISVNVKTDNLRDTLLLIDEPDISLHPSGIRYLRDELIKISQTNYLVYSSHSIFMIDSGDVGRHYIVKKKDEITSVETAEASNIADEEVLYNALGHSVFSIIKEHNLIFEGWKDKHLFLTALQNASSDIKRKYKNVGICHAKGVKSIKTITPMIELVKRQCVIVSDSDKPAKEQKSLYKKEKGFGEWKTYQDIDSGIQAVTGEDFIKNDFITKQVRTALRGKAMPAFDETVLPEKTEKLSAISKWLTGNGMTSDQAKDTIDTIKNSLFQNLKSTNIDEAEYKKLLKGSIF